MLSLNQYLDMILGRVTVPKAKSVKARWQKIMYVGFWRDFSHWTKTKMKMFPVMMDKKRMKSRAETRPWKSGESPGNPTRKKSLMVVMLVCNMFCYNVFKQVTLEAVKQTVDDDQKQQLNPNQQPRLWQGSAPIITVFHLTLSDPHDTTPKTNRSLPQGSHPKRVIPWHGHSSLTHSKQSCVKTTTVVQHYSVIGAIEVLKKFILFFIVH